jgi:hypothetical protein
MKCMKIHRQFINSGYYFLDLRRKDAMLLNCVCGEETTTTVPASEIASGAVAVGGIEIVQAW